MFCIRESNIVLMTVLLTLMIFVLPVNAYSVALYGTNSGFNPDLHRESVTVVKSIPGSAGADLDSTIDQFIQPSVDVVILGGEDTFSPATAAKLEAAVAEGKILVVTYPCNRKFDTSLPATNGGTSLGGQTLIVADPNTAESKVIFAGLPARFDLQNPAPDKEQAAARSGTVTLLNFDSGMPAFIYGKYGRGYVIEWTSVPTPSYMSAKDADIVLDRLITRLLPAPATTQIITTPVIPITSIQQADTPVQADTTQSAESVENSGEVVVYSSPLGASILIDGVYRGTTPANLTGISQGNHIIRLTQSGYYDYEGTLYIVPGQTSHAFGTLPPLNQVSAAPTAIPIIVPVITAEPTQTTSKGLLENSSVIVAIIGVITASIAAAATIFTQVNKVKKEGKE
jgi:hypothetical protein